MLKITKPYPLKFPNDKLNTKEGSKGQNWNEKHETSVALKT